jgi:hypothetical protein
MSKHRPSNELKRIVSERAGGVCEYCYSQAAFSSQPFFVEHIFPAIKGGATVAENLAFACQGCNNHKYTNTESRDAVTRAIVSLFHPRKQNWNEHFAWNDDFSLIIGITPTGRATVDALQLNREGCVNLRGALYAVGKHPPNA